MELPSKTMYDAFKDEIWEELGPLDPDWFQVLTAQTLTKEITVSDENKLCANQEEEFKTPLDKTAPDSQLFSTPKVFRQSQVVSPETEDEQSFTTEHGKETLPWTETQSPHLFQFIKERVPGNSPVSHAKQISESLGAQIHPDISWTSSLNTPPAVPSTLILSRHDESACPMSASADKNVVFVRKLFPSLSNTPCSSAVSPLKNDKTPGHQGVVAPEPSQSPESHHSPQESLNPSESVWRQKLPDAIEDGDVRSTVAGVLDGAETVLSIFFSNSSSALRKVKTDRVKRKQIIPTKEQGYSSSDISTTNYNAPASEERTDEEPVKPSSPPPLQTKYTGITQWSPLSLSEIPLSCHNNIVTTQVESNIAAEHRQSDSGSRQLDKEPLKSSYSGFAKKKRKFVYTVDTSKTQETQSQRMNAGFQIPNSGDKVSVSLLTKAPNEADSCKISKNETPKQENITEDDPPQSLQPKVQDLDMSQLCKDFAQDFSQMLDHGKPSKRIEDMPRNGFSPSAYLTGMKQVKQRARQENLYSDCNGISNRIPTPGMNKNISINEGTVDDSGFQSAAADITHLTTSFPSSGQSQRLTGFQAILSASANNGKKHFICMLQESKSEAEILSAIEESQTLGPCKEAESHIETMSTQPPSVTKAAAIDFSCSPTTCQVNGFPDRTPVSPPSVQPSGFKTASHKDIDIYSANMERAKHFFKENEAKQTFSHQLTKRAQDIKDETNVTNGFVKSALLNSNQPPSHDKEFGNDSCQLTASQKADVTELCTLLEEADSKFEFTQIKATKLHQQDNDPSAQKVEKDLDPDFLMGIDFDDSFSADAEKYMARTVRHDKISPLGDDKTSSMKSENSSFKDASSSSNHVSEGRTSVLSPKPQNLNNAGYTETIKHVDENPSVLCEGFKTARGGVLSVSTKCMSKARALFADLEENQTDQKSVDKQSSEVDAKMCQRGFQMASGKEISISAKALQEANAVFKDCDVCYNNTGVSVKPKNNTQHLPSFIIQKKFKTMQGNKETCSEKPISEYEKAGTPVCLTKVKQHNVENQSFAFTSTATVTNTVSSDANLSLTTKALSSPSCTTSKLPGSSAINQWSSGGGFCTASGKRVSISADALKKAESLLNGVHTLEDTNDHQKQKGDALRTGHVTNQSQDERQNKCGFQTASGKGVIISPAALKKAKSLLSECESAGDKFSVKPTYSKMPSHALSSKDSGFLAASVLPEAKDLSSDITFRADTPAVSGARDSDRKQDKAARSDKIQCGFMTAGGAPVCVSQKNLLRAKSILKESDEGLVSETATQEAGGLFKDCDMMDNNSEISKDQRLKNSYEEHENGQTELEIPNKGQFVINSPDTTNANPSLNTKLLSSPTSKNFSTGGGFSTASGKKVLVSEEAMAKAKSLLSESADFGDMNPKKGGKEVAVSFAAPKNTKSLSNKGYGIEDRINVTPTHSQIPVCNSSSRNGGFLAASGKPVAFSSEALQKAKALFSDIHLGAEIPTVSVTASTEKHRDAPQNSAETMPCGFTTAGGAKVHVSQKNLLKAKDLLGEFADGIVPQEENETIDASECRDNSIIGNHHGEDNGSMLDCKVNHASSSKIPKFKKTEESSGLMLQSLDLSGCTETQQWFLAQEALDCTKALLDDESLAGHSISVTSGNGPLQDDPKSQNRSVGQQKGRVKRLVEDSDIIGQPPLKRRLLEEFDRSFDEPRSSALQPQNSCPNSVLQDRRAFKYSVSPHPNITRPHKNATNYMETKLQSTTGTQYSASVHSRSAHFKMEAFVPPFLKNAKTEICKSAACNVNIKTYSSFVPPFKKQKVTVQESSAKPLEEGENKQLSVTSSNSDTFVPPFKKTQRSTDVAGDENREDIQTVALPQTTNDNLLSNQNGPVGWASEESPVKTSCATEETFSRSQDMLRNLVNVEMARDMQDMRIRKKKRQRIQPLPGSLFLTKTSGVSRIPLQVAVNGKPPARYTPKQLYEHGVHQHVFKITSEMAEAFRFRLLQFLRLEAFRDEGGVQLADGGWLIPSSDGTAGKDEFYRALCDTPGVDPKLISEEWVYNHYRWIVWKQASMERSFPETMGSRCLTPEQVLLQLKYRYDVEIDNSRRPALRKIMEKDDTAAKTLVLCVCGIVSRGHLSNEQSRNDAKTPQGADTKVKPPSAVVWLTDGWYAIKAQMDEPLTAMLHKGRLAVGGKLIIYGAQLVGSQDACSPLEAPESLMLKICTNSTRSARWDTKLGFHRDPRPFLLPVSSLYSNGGPVGCVDITILRSYPIQWMERKTDGGVVFRSDRAEEKEARRYSSHKQKAIEILFAKIQAEFEKEQKGINKPQHRKLTMSRLDITNLQDGEELYDAVGDDPSYFEAHLSEQQLETLQTYRRSLMERRQAELQDRYRRALEAENGDGNCPKREVTPVWRLCVADSMEQTGSVYQLSLWRPPSDLQSLLKEGCRYKVYNLNTSDGRKRSGIETVQLTGTKKTQFQDLQASQEWLSAHFQPRISTNFLDLQNPDFQPLCGEVDLTGYIISVIDGQGSSPAFYLADGQLNVIKVRCFSSLAQSGLEDVVKPCALLALSNLQLRGQSTSPTPVVYAGDLTVFSTNPKEAHLQESLCQLRNLVQAHENFLLTAEERLSDLVKSDGLSSISSPALHPRIPACTSDKRQDKTSQPNRGLGSFTPLSRNPPVATSSTEKDPRSLKRRRALDFLSRIPSPPALSHLNSVASPGVKKTFNPPRRAATPSTLNPVQTPARKPVVSPVEEEWVNDEELAMIDTQSLRVGGLL